jgi:peptidoglycan/xylan/chitin deacetylase (PgdA/CDA1 family)
MGLKTVIMWLMALLAAAPPCALADPRSGFAWPGGARAAVSLSYDDALDSQLDNAIPALGRHGFRASFYLTLANPSVRLRLDAWRAAAAHGHELGNHGMFHPCSASGPDREWVTPWNDLDRMPVAALKQRIQMANTVLHAIDGREERTFTTLCGDLETGGEPYLPAIRDEFVAIKNIGGSVTPDMRTLDPWAVGVGAPAGASGEELIAIVRAAAERGTMANLTFHGVGGDYLAVSEEAHEQLLQHLEANPDIYWVDTFLTIMKYVRAQRDEE